MAKSSKPVNKSQSIRNAIDHLGWEVKPKEIHDYPLAQNVEVTDAVINTTKSQYKKKSDAGRSALMKQPSAQAPSQQTAAVDVVTVLEKVAELAKEVGGCDNLKRIIDGCSAMETSPL